MHGWIVSSNKDAKEMYFRSYGLALFAVADLIENEYIPIVRRAKQDVSVVMRCKALTIIDIEKLIQAIVTKWGGGDQDALTAFLANCCPELRNEIKRAIERQKHAR